MIGFDPDDLIYRVDRPIGVLAGDVPTGSLINRSPMVLVAPPSVIDHARAGGLIAESVLVTELEPGDSLEVAFVPRSELPPIPGDEPGESEPGAGEP